MSDSGFTNQILELTREKRRELQFCTMKAWMKGKITGRQCIEQIVDLERVIVLDMKEVNRIRRSSEQTRIDSKDSSD